MSKFKSVSLSYMLLVGLSLALTVLTVFALTSSPTQWYDKFNVIVDNCSQENDLPSTNFNFRCELKKGLDGFNSNKVSNYESLARALKIPKKPKPVKGSSGGGGGGGGGAVGLGGLAAAVAAPALAAASGGLGPAFAASLLRIPAIMISVAVPLGTVLMSGQAVIMAQVALVIAVIVGLQLALNGNSKHDHKDSVVKHVFLEQKDIEKLIAQSNNIVFPNKLKRIYL